MQQTSRELQSRDMVLGISGGDPVPAGESREFSKVTSLPFMPQRLVIPSACAPAFEIEELRIGHVNAESGAVTLLQSAPATRFTEFEDQRLNDMAHMADTNEPITIRVKNTSNVEQKFNCAVTGQGFTENFDGPKMDPPVNRLRLMQKLQDDLSDRDDDKGSQTIQALQHIADLIADLAKKPTKPERTNMVGFDITRVPANTAVEITKKPQVLFRGERLSIPDSIAEHFMIVDIKVGKNSQFVAVGEMPASTFRESAPVQEIKLDVCQVGMYLTLYVRNKTDQDQEFSASMFGPVVD